MNITDLVAALKARWTTAVAIAVAVLALTAVWALSQPKIYRASASLLFDISQAEPVDSGKAASAAALLATQSDILKSGAVAQEVVRRLRAQQGSRPSPSAADDASLRSEAAALVSKLQVSTGNPSNVLVLRYLDDDPERAARVANAFARVYLEKQLELRIAPARGYAQWFEERTKDVRERLESAQMRLSAYQRERGIIGVDRMDLEAERLRTMSAELAAAEGAASDASARASSGNVPEVSNSPVVQNLRSQIALKEAQVAELSRTLGPNHPRMQAARAELGTLRSELNQEIRQAAGSLAAASNAARSREAQIRARMAAQQDRMLKMSGDQDQLAVLQRDVEAARQAYDTVRQRFSEVSLQSELSQTNVSLLDQAEIPLWPISPNVPLLLFLGAALGTMLGLSLVVVTELLSPRVRTVRGIEEATQVPVLVDLGASSRSLRLRDSLDAGAVA